MHVLLSVGVFAVAFSAAAPQAPPTGPAIAGAWERLAWQMTPQQVEDLLGKPHRVVRRTCSATMPNLLPGSNPIVLRCPTWVMPDGGLLQFEVDRRDVQRLVLDRWRQPGAKTFSRR